jgi:glyoxylase-like metal-dependent hydrolase (beta-lactamase superfamily II)
VSGVFSVGDLELVPVSDGWFRLDGGAMFGVVPKVLWARRVTPDVRNRIRLGLRPLVVRGVRTMLIDAGMGDKWDAKSADIYGLEQPTPLEASLNAAGVALEDIDIVLASHLHFDHAGGFTRRDATGRLVPTFPRAQYVFRRGEWEDAMRPNDRNRASYLAENFAPLAEAGVLQLVDDDATIMPGVRIERSGGHTMHHHIVRLESRGRTAVFPGDMIPTTAHVAPPWLMAYDLYPLDTLSFKQRFLREAAAGEYLVFFEHEPEVVAGYLREREGKWTVEQA